MALYRIVVQDVCWVGGLVSVASVTTPRSVCDDETKNDGKRHSDKNWFSLRARTVLKLRTIFKGQFARVFLLTYLLKS